MQVFIPYPEPIKVAECLDKKRLLSQIREAKQIIAAIEGSSKAWRNHPVVKMYQPHKKWLECYKNTLELYSKGFVETAKLASDEARVFKPIWLTEKLCITHRRRLYKKNPTHYEAFAKYGFSDLNFYVVDNQVLVYQNGKVIHTESLINYV